jgi:hypothetical protein
LSNTLRSSSMKPSDMPLPLLYEKFDRSFTCGMVRRKAAPAWGIAFLNAIYLD